MNFRISGVSSIGLAALGLWTAAGPVAADGFTATPLITHATDPDLLNPWGLSFSGGSPVWVSDNDAGVATLYNINPVTNVAVKQALRVTIPGDGSPTGQVFSGTSAFNGDTFLFASEDGTISGWRGALGTTAENLQLASPTNVYKGLAIAPLNGTSYLYAANFRSGTIDVLKGTSAAPNLTGNFVDPTIPAGFAPFNVQNLNGTLYVTYAKQDAAKFDDVAGLGNGFVDAFDLNGNLLGRVGSNGTLNSPWGLTLAPASFGGLANDLLVGDFGDGHINIFSNNLTAGNPGGTDSFLGQLLDAHGNPITIGGLWALTPGNNGGAGSSADLYYSAASPAGGSLGLIVASTPEPGSVATVAGLALSGSLLAWRRRRRSARP